MKEAFARSAGLNPSDVVIQLMDAATEIEAVIYHVVSILIHNFRVGIFCKFQSGTFKVESLKYLNHLTGRDCFVANSLLRDHHSLIIKEIILKLINESLEILIVHQRWRWSNR